MKLFSNAFVLSRGYSKVYCVLDRKVFTVRLKLWQKMMYVHNKLKCYGFDYNNQFNKYKKTFPVERHVYPIDDKINKLV